MQEVGIELAAAYRHRVNFIEDEIDAAESRHIAEAIETCFNKSFFFSTNSTILVASSPSSTPFGRPTKSEPSSRRYANLLS